MLSGSLPNEVFNLESLKELWLGENKMTGSLPDNIGRMAALGKLLIFLSSYNDVYLSLI